MNITFLFFLNIYLYFLNIYIVNLIILDLILLLIFITFFSLEYIKINKRYKYIKKLTDNLTEKYLIAEILPKPQTLEEKAYYYALKKACKSLNDKLTEIENKYQNYEEYIESFVHEIKSPISVISLIGDNENNQTIKEETRKIDDLCEQILFFSRTKNPENDYFIKKINLEDVIHKTLIDYSATKGAITVFTKSLALSLADAKIRVNAVAPGPIWTPLIPASFSAEEVEIFGTDVPLKRAGQPFEVSPAYLYLASDDSRYVTGQVLHVNGGSMV